MGRVEVWFRRDARDCGNGEVKIMLGDERRFWWVEDRPERMQGLRS